MTKAIIKKITRNDKEIQTFNIPNGIINIPSNLVSSISVSCFVAKELIQNHRSIASQIIGTMHHSDLLIIENEFNEYLEIPGSDLLDLLN